MRSMDFILGVEKLLACTSPDTVQGALQILAPGVFGPPASSSMFINVTGQVGHPDFFPCPSTCPGSLAMMLTLPKPPLHRLPGPHTAPLAFHCVSKANDLDHSLLRS